MFNSNIFNERFLQTILSSNTSVPRTSWSSSGPECQCIERIRASAVSWSPHTRMLPAVICLDDQWAFADPVMLGWSEGFDSANLRELVDECQDLTSHTIVCCPLPPELSAIPIPRFRPRVHRC